MTRLPPRVELIQRELDRFERPRYLEIGVHIGVVLLNVRAAAKTGVDPVPRIGLRRRLRHPFGLRRTQLVAATSDQYFSRLSEDARFEVVFIDGLHLREQVLLDVENSIRHLAPEGVVMLHDCNPATEAAASRDSSEAARSGDGGWCGDVWKAIVELRATRPDLQVEVLDTDYGVGVVRWGTSHPLPLSLAEVLDLGFEDLDADRTRLLNLVDPRERLGK